MAISDKIFDEILKDLKNPMDLDSKGGIFDQLKKGLIERVLQTEMTHHLGYEKHNPEGNNSGNSRNGTSKKTVITSDSQLEIDVPRDRNSSYDPILLAKWQKRFPTFDSKVLALYSRGMSTREIQGYLKEIYLIDISPELISMVTDAVIQEVEEWRSRELAELYPIVYFDALMVSIKDNGYVRKKAVHIALGVNLEGKKEVLGMWINETEGAKYWLYVLNELYNRGLKKIYIACADGLKGFDESLEAVYSKSIMQVCIVHMVRNSLKYVSWKERSKVAADLKTIYSSSTEDEAKLRLAEFRGKWDEKYPLVGKSWESNWGKVIPFLQFPGYIRKAIYTTNAIESLHMSLRRILKTKSSFPNDDAAMKLIYLGIRNASRRWTVPIVEWEAALNQFLIVYGGQ